MADTLAARLSLDDVRASVKRMQTRVQTEGRKLVTQLRKDANALAKRRPLDLVEDARKRATKAVRDLQAQRGRVQAFLVDSLSELAEQAVTRAGLARAKEVSELKRRVNDLERRIERVTKAA
jgi:polyhydroxyalkanoate synthesis regulator phasin